MGRGLTIDGKLIFNRLGQDVIRLRNNSGGTVNAGAVVVLDTTVTDAFTTTTSQNSPLVIGVCLQTVANQATAEILREGFTDLLKVDGTTDIAKGDYLTTFTSAEIAAKRTATTSAGVFAIALEAYTTNDSNGVIDAWIVPVSRVAGATSTWSDDALLNLGADNDIALVLRSTLLAADGTLAGVVEGTADTLETAANSLIIANVTDDGDIHIVVSKGGNSHTAFLADGSTGDTILNAATGQSVDLYVAGTKEYDFSATAVDLNGNHLDNAGYLIMNAVTLPASTEVYIGHDNAGDATINALTGKKVLLAVAGTDVVDVAGAAITLRQAVTVSTGGITVTGDSTITGGLTVTGSLTFGGNWTVGATLTVDELVLDTDGVAPAGTVNYLVNDNTGDTTANVLTGKQFIVAVNGSDEYTFSSTVLDMLANALDNCGYIILNAATAPAATEVSLVNDNTGDLTLNALTTKSINLAVANIDIVALNYTLATTSGSLIVNETGEDINIRMETDGLAYAIYSDGGKNCVVLGDNTDISSADAMVVIGNVAKTVSNNGTWAQLKITATASATGQGTNATMATVEIGEPNLTAGGATITNAASLLITGAPTEGGTGNYAAMIQGSIGMISDAVDLVIGAGRDVLMRWSTADADNHAFAIGLGASNAVHIAQGADIATDWNVAADTNPQLYVHSATTPATDYVTMRHTGSTAIFEVRGATQFQLQIGATVEYEPTSTSFYLNDNSLTGSQAAHSADTADGSLYLISTLSATKGFVCIANADLGLIIGSDGSVDRATTVGTNSIHVFNGTAPVGTLANGISLYSTGGECYIMDAAGNATLQSQHDSDGDLIMLHYSAKQNKTRRIYLEKLLHAIASDPQYAQYFEETPGLKHNKEWAIR